ncbi:MAG: hypothetical protein ACI9BW_002225, partial [Gammaproteobacteria bacterium]
SCAAKSYSINRTRRLEQHEKLLPNSPVKNNSWQSDKLRGFRHYRLVAFS